MREYRIRVRDQMVPILQFNLARRGGSEVDMWPATSDRIYVEAQQYMSVYISFLYGKMTDKYIAQLYFNYCVMLLLTTSVSKIRVYVSYLTILKTPL